MPPSVPEIENAKGAPTYFKETTAPSRSPEYRIIYEIDLVKPEFFLLVNVPTSWAYAPNAPRDILTWTDDYTYANYNLVGTVDLASTAKTEYRWNQAAVGIVPRSQVNPLVFKRKPGW